MTRHNIIIITSMALLSGWITINTQVTEHGSLNFLHDIKLSC